MKREIGYLQTIIIIYFKKKLKLIFITRIKVDEPQKLI